VRKLLRGEHAWPNGVLGSGAAGEWI
jgi:hypothetical protein